MYLFWLSTFKKVIDEGSYTRAAAGLFVSQSAVSQQVRQLEKLFGAKLIQMAGRRLELTQAGQLVYKFASSMEGEYDATRHAIDELLGRARSHIVIVSSMPVLLHRLPAVMKRFWENHPEVSIETYMRTGDELCDNLKSGFADVGIYTGDDFDTSLEALQVWQDEIVAVVAPDHALVEATVVEPATIAHNRIVIGGGAETRSLVDGWFEALNVRLVNVMELPSFDGLRAAVVESEAVAFAPRYAVEEDLRSGRLVQLDIAVFAISARTYVLNRPDVREPGRWLIELLAQAETAPSVATT